MRNRSENVRINNETTNRCYIVPKEKNSKHMAIKSKKINEAILDEAKKIANAKMRGLKESYDDADDADYGDDVQDDDLDSGETKDLKAMAESSAKSVFKDGYMVDRSEERRVGKEC